MTGKYPQVDKSLSLLRHSARVSPILRDAVDDVEAEVRRLRAVAHAAWHLLDDGGEVPDDPGTIYASKRDADRLSDALDGLEAGGWDAHPEAADLGRTEGSNGR